MPNDEMKNWEIENDMRMLREADKIRKSPKRLGRIKKMMKSNQQDMERILDMSIGGKRKK